MVNSGTVTASAGTLLLAGGDGGGSQPAASPAPPGMAFDGGIFDVAVATTATLGNGVEQSSGTLEGAGTWRVNGAVAWTAGTWAGTGQTLVVAGETLTKSSPAGPA